MATSDDRRMERLDGWKAIAEYLGVTERTARNWTQGKGLPVRRNADSEKSRVWAFADELRKWRESRELGGEEAAFPDAEVHGQHADLGQPPAVSIVTQTSTNGLNRRRWLNRVFLSLAGAVGVGGLSLATAKYWPDDHNRPMGFRVEGADLVVTGKNGVELWRNRFPSQLLPDFYRVPPRTRILFADLDGDGHEETLFLVATQTDDAQTLACFDRSGKPRWTFKTEESVTDNLDRRWAPPFWPTRFEILRSGRSSTPKIVVSSVHNWSFPCQISVLDGQSGKQMSIYWHRGHLNHISVADLDGDGEAEVLVAGVNDAPEYKQATVIEFDHRHISGACRDPKGQVYFKGMDPGSERRIVLFPRTPISELQEFNRVRELRLGPGRITVITAEGVDVNANGSVIYEFDYSWNPLNAALDSKMVELYSEFQAAKKLPKEDPVKIAQGLMERVRFVRPNW